MSTASAQPRATGKLTIDSAVHGRIELPLTPGVMTVGRSLSSDVVLADPTVGNLHFRLHVSSEIKLECVDGAVTLSEGGAIAPGESAVIQNTAGYKAGSVAMYLDIPTSPEKRRPAMWPRMVAALAILGFLGSAAYAFADRTVPYRAENAVADVTKTSQIRPPAASYSPQHELDARQLVGIQIRQTPDGTYHATGSISAHDAPVWREAARAIVDGSGGQIVLLDRVIVEKPVTPLAIQSAWVGPQPYIIDGAGQKLFVGAVVTGGWTINGIEAGRVTLRRQGQSLAVTF